MKYLILDNFDFLDDDNSYGEKFEYWLQIIAKFCLVS